MIHIEAQSTSDGGFARRMLRYFMRLYDKFDIPVYPVAIFSYETPLSPAEENHTVAFLDRVVMNFSYHAIQLNRLNWRYVNITPNNRVTPLNHCIGFEFKSFP